MQALALALTLDTMQRLEAEDGNELLFSARLDSEDAGLRVAGGGEWVPIDIEHIVCPLPGPNPLLETKSEFLDRALREWDEAAAELLAQGISPSVPRTPERHCEWLVRYHVRGETAAEIVKDLEDIDPSTVYKAVRAMADLIGVPLRLSARHLN